MDIPGVEPLSPAERLGVDLAKAEFDLIRRLVALREAAGIRPAELARRFGVDRSVISRFEAGGTNPTMATINRYAEAVGALIRYDVQPYRPACAADGGGSVLVRPLTLVAEEGSRAVLADRGSSDTAARRWAVTVDEVAR